MVTAKIANGLCYANSKISRGDIAFPMFDEMVMTYPKSVYAFTSTQFRL